MKGLESVQSRLQRLADQASQALKSALQEAGEETLRSAQAHVPVRTGRLKSSLEIRMEDMASHVESLCPYAANVELGTLHAPAQPFLLPAARETDYPARAARAVKEILK